MAISKKLINRLDELGLKYDLITHKKVYTAYDAAQTLKKDLAEIVKTLMVKAGSSYYLVHLPANKNLNLVKLAKILDVKKVTIPKENDLVKFLKIKPGSLTAFSFVYKVGSLVDKSLLKVKKAIFSSGSLVESFEMQVKDFLKTDQVEVGIFSEAKKIKKGKSLPRAKSSSAGRSRGVKNRGKTKKKK